MFGSMVLEVAIGLVFVYLLLSLIVTAVTELISGWLRWRSQNLWTGIRNLLDSDGAAKWAARLYSHPLIEGLSPAPNAAKKSATAAKVAGPSYIPSRTFAIVLLDLIKDDPSALNWADIRQKIAALATTDPKLGRALLTLLDESHQDIDLFKKNIEIWFNNSMERVSGWYKRKTQAIHVLIAIIVTLFVNVDSVLVVNALSQNQALRQSLVSEAEAYAKKQDAAGSQASGATGATGAAAAPSSPEASPAAATAPAQPAPTTPTGQDPLTSIEKIHDQISKLDLPIGWMLPGQTGFDPRNSQFRGWPGWHPGKNTEWLSLWEETLRFHFIGWLLTAFALSLGAPFWFDMLNKVINIRSSGKSPEEQPKSPQKVPQPREPGAEPGVVPPLG